MNFTVVNLRLLLGAQDVTTHSAGTMNFTVVNLRLCQTQLDEFSLESITEISFRQARYSLHTFWSKRLSFEMRPTIYHSVVGVHFQIIHSD